jgi:hypothetical protein
MENDNEKLVLVVIVGLITLGAFTYLFHKSEMKELRYMEDRIRMDIEESHPQKESLLDKLEQVKEL